MPGCLHQRHGRARLLDRPAPLSRNEEVAALLKIALPLIAAYLAELAIFLTTKAIVGRLGYEELAAVGLAGHLCLEVLVIAMGLLSVVGVFVAQALDKKIRSRPATPHVRDL